MRAGSSNQNVDGVPSIPAVPATKKPQGGTLYGFCKF